VSEPNIHRGDGGETQLGSGQRVRKDDLRIECVGSVDELSSFLGLARAGLEAQAARTTDMVASLRRVQRELYVLGAELARRDGESKITAEHVTTLDREIADIDAGLPRSRPSYTWRARFAVASSARPCTWLRLKPWARRSFPT
jgi:cob(I)alamin adenosyltransferase